MTATLDAIQEELNFTRKTFEIHRKAKCYSSMATTQAYINGLEFAKKNLINDIRTKTALEFIRKIANTPTESWFESTTRCFRNEAKNIIESGNK
jgi:hypothetical protein